MWKRGREVCPNSSSASLSLRCRVRRAGQTPVKRPRHDWSMESRGVLLLLPYVTAEQVSTAVRRHGAIAIPLKANVENNEGY